MWQFGRLTRQQISYILAIGRRYVLLFVVYPCPSRHVDTILWMIDLAPGLVLEGRTHVIVGGHDQYSKSHGKRGDVDTRIGTFRSGVVCLRHNYP